MSNSVTPAVASPFDSLRHSDERGEFWLARELMKPLGYGADWRNFVAAIERARATGENTGVDVSSAFAQVAQFVDANNLGIQARQDYRLTRYAAYLVAMNGDPRKPEIAAAQSYFAIKTREAEAGIQRRPGDLNLLRDMIDEIEADRARIGVLEVGQRALEAKVSASQGEHDEFTTLAYAKIHGLPVDLVSTSQHGRRVSKWMRDRGREIRKVNDLKYGPIGVYPVEALDATRA